MKIEKFSEEKSTTSVSNPDVDQNLEWANQFIKNFNDVYEKENQSFFIKICRGQHHRFYIAFILHPANTFSMGNSVCIVNADQYHRQFKEEFKTAYKIVYELNRAYLERKNLT